MLPLLRSVSLHLIPATPEELHQEMRDCLGQLYQDRCLKWESLLSSTLTRFILMPYHRVEPLLQSAAAMQEWAGFRIAGGRSLLEELQALRGQLGLFEPVGIATSLGLLTTDSPLGLLCALARLVDRYVSLFFRLMNWSLICVCGRNDGLNMAGDSVLTDTQLVAVECGLEYTLLEQLTPAEEQTIVACYFEFVRSDQRWAVRLASNVESSISGKHEVIRVTVEEGRRRFREQRFGPEADVRLLHRTEWRCLPGLGDVSATAVGDGTRFMYGTWFSDRLLC